MKEIPLRELLGMADPSAGMTALAILWNQKAIHYLVVFTCTEGDFELIGVGPTLPYTTLEEAEHHSISDKTPEFYIKCPAAIAGRLQPKLAPSPRTSSGTPMVNPAATPTMKARTAAPFSRPQIKLNPKPSPESPEPGAGSGELKAGSAERGAGSVAPKLETPSSQPSTPTVSPATSGVQPATTSSLAAREQAILQREKELAALAAAMKIHETSLRQREAAIAAIEERLLNPPRQTPQP